MLPLEILTQYEIVIAGNESVDLFDFVGEVSTTRGFQAALIQQGEILL